MESAVDSPGGAASGPIIQRSGTQAVDRALTLLHHIASGNGGGQPLGALARRSGLDAATARRLLRALINHGFVEQDDRSRNYYLGLDFFTLAAAASNRLDLAESVRASLFRLQMLTGRNAVYRLMSGADLVCVDSVRPAGAVEAGTGQIGARIPVGSDAFGIAVLAALPELEAEDLVIQNIRRFSLAPEDTVRDLRSAILATRRDGYTVAGCGSAGTAGLSVALINRDGRPQGAIGLEWPGFEAVDQASVRAMAKVILDEVRLLQDALWRSTPEKGHPPAPMTH